MIFKFEDKEVAGNSEIEDAAVINPEVKDIGSAINHIVDLHIEKTLSRVTVFFRIAKQG